jgi:hypothetical protein
LVTCLRAGGYAVVAAVPQAALICLQRDAKEKRMFGVEVMLRASVANGIGKAMKVSKQGVLETYPYRLEAHIYQPRI